MKKNRTAPMSSHERAANSVRKGMWPRACAFRDPLHHANKYACRGRVRSW